MAVRSSVGTPGSGVMGRREPCAKCGYPVFLAERLNVGTKLYHRTCFRCARCNTQLSLANCYETEMDGQYCCETCPDEEESTKKLAKFNSSDTLKSDKSKPDTDTSKTDSMTDVKDPFDLKRQRLDQMRNRSLSDEEKRKGLQQFEDDEYSSHFEHALEDSNEKNYQDDSVLSKARNTFLSSHLLEEEMKTDSESDVAPPLPESKPPDNSMTSLTTKRLSPKSATISTSLAEELSVYSVEPTNVDASVVDVNNTVKISDKSDQPVTASDTTLEDTTIIREKPSTKDTNRSSLVKSRMLMFETGDAVQSKLTSPPSYDKSKVSAVSKYFSSNKDAQKTARTSTDAKHKVPLVDSAKTDISEEITSTNLQTDETTLPVTIRDIEVSDTDLEITDDTSIDRPITLTVDKVCDPSDPIVEISVPQTPESPVQDIEDAPDSVEDNSDVNKSVSQDPISSIDSIDIKIIEETFEKPSESVEDMSVEEPQSVVANIDLKIEITKTDDDSVAVVEETRYPSVSSEDALEESNANYKTVRSELLSDSLVVEPSVSVESTPISKAPLKFDPMMKRILTQSILEDLSLDQSPVTLDPSILDSTAASKSDADYPEDLNPFGDEDEDIQDVQDRRVIKPSTEDLTLLTPSPVPRKNKTKSAERKSTNPFGSSDEDEETVVKTKPPRPPMPATRSNDESGGQKKLLEAPKLNLNPFWTSEDEPSDEETNAKPVPMPRSSKSLGTPEPRPRRSGMSNNAERYDSNSSLSSLNSSISHTPGRKKKPAPPPPATPGQKGVGTSPLGSKQTSPSTSTQPSPKLTPRVRKSRKAPLPPSSTPCVAKRASESTDISPIVTQAETQISPIEPKLVSENQTGETIYFSPMDSMPSIDIEKEKIDKDEKNRNRQSQSIASPISDSDSLSLSQSPALDKSTHGKWKRKKGPAPARPVPQRRQIKPLPLTELRRELDIIEMQQQGLEKQGVKLEQLIREKCETPETNDDTVLSPEVEDLVLELFELVNEKNELFRRQAELMYLRREQRLEEEQADLEYQIRCLMHRPERNITDSDKTREEELIHRLVEVVERRNEIVECLEMDRVREAEEDQSINSRLSLIASKRDEENNQLESPVKLSKKEKKKIKKEKKLKEKGKTLDIDKDIDESESHNNTLTSVAVKEKKKKKWF